MQQTAVKILKNSFTFARQTRPDKLCSKMHSFYFWLRISIKNICVQIIKIITTTVHL